MYGSSLIQFSASCFHNISQTERRPKIKDKLFQYFLDLSMKCAYLHRKYYQTIFIKSI